MRDAWLATTGQLQMQLNNSTFNMRIKPLQPACFNGKLLLTSSSSFGAGLAEQIKFQIARALERVYGEPVEIEIRALEVVLGDEVAV